MITLKSNKYVILWFIWIIWLIVHLYSADYVLSSRQHICTFNNFGQKWSLCVISRCEAHLCKLIPIDDRMTGSIWMNADSIISCSFYCKCKRLIDNRKSAVQFSIESNILIHLHFNEREKNGQTEYYNIRRRWSQAINRRTTAHIRI